ncbi:BrnA antitoxin family protein [Acuticoccus sp. M5D2P5]|uniref:BrnA antitoxin family protein n=1 Tax=Acuticoccus kalidii TaxID=2910977 RepID=UPI001F24C845|nr:BrnA antitoxin family protein [Acuticoccus kalidii]MCF3935280.1 BrnA antitoxin family protein [Acuticoccus kalidii]
MKKPPEIRDNTPTEEAEIQRQIASDPDTWGTPADAKAIRRGRPFGRTKEQVTVRIDRDVLAALQTPEPKGWQTRLNEALRAGLKL